MPRVIVDTTEWPADKWEEGTWADARPTRKRVVNGHACVIDESCKADVWDKQARRLVPIEYIRPAVQDSAGKWLFPPMTFRKTDLAGAMAWCSEKAMSL